LNRTASPGRAACRARSPGFGRVFIELRLHPRLHRRFHHGPRRPADTDQQVHTPPRGVPAHLPVQLLAGRPQFEHLAQHRNAPRSRSFA